MEESFYTGGTNCMTIILWFICTFGDCRTETITLSPEAVAIAACESGDTVTFGSMNWNAINVNHNKTIDTGAFQFNSYWVWSKDDTWVINPVASQYSMTASQFIALYPTARDAPPNVQYAMFQHLWNNGYGWQHWSASRPCWSKWLTITNDNQAVFNQ